MSQDHFKSPQALPEGTLREMAEAFQKNARAAQECTWECFRLAELLGEIERRKRHRRGKADA